MQFAEAYQKVGLAEGKWSNHKNDKGGLTCCGIARIKNPDCAIWPYVDKLLERGNTLEEAEKIARSDTHFMSLVEAFYRGKYWNRCKCEMMPSLWRYPVFSCAVNCGEGKAIKLLQKALGVKDDGIIGVKTQDGFFTADKQETLAKFYKYWDAWYKKIVATDSSQAVFLNGWQNRIKAVQAENHE